MGPIGQTIKRLTDILVSVVVIVLVSPLFLLCSLMIVFTMGMPVIFKQLRLGKNGVPFRLLKFRSMVNNPPDIRNEDGSAFTGADDPRVTRVGRFLRKTSLDELPQFFNVLLGSMSLVGPRPDQIDQRKYYSEVEEKKLLVKPGITGLAQISGRNKISWEQRKALDVYYVENQSLWLDLVIILKTVPYVLLQRGVNEK